MSTEKDLRKQKKIKVANDPSDPLNVTGTIAATPGPAQYVHNGVDTEVELDTATPANNRPLPVDLYDINGQRGTTSNKLQVNDASGLSKLNEIADLLDGDLPGELGNIVTAEQETRDAVIALNGDVGDTTDLAATTDTGTFSLIALFKRLLQKFTTQFPAALIGGRFDINIGSWFGSTAPTIGQKTMANSIPVVLPSDQVIAVDIDLGTTEAHGTVAVTTGSQLVVALNTNRKEIILFNDTNKRISVCPFTPALITEGIIIESKTSFILDTSDRALYVIGATGVSGNLIWQEINE